MHKKCRLRLEKLRDGMGGLIKPSKPHNCLYPWARETAHVPSRWGTMEVGTWEAGLWWAPPDPPTGWHHQQPKLLKKGWVVGKSLPQGLPHVGPGWEGVGWAWRTAALGLQVFILAHTRPTIYWHRQCDVPLGSRPLGLIL